MTIYIGLVLSLLVIAIAAIIIAVGKHQEARRWEELYHDLLKGFVSTYRSSPSVSPSMSPSLSMSPSPSMSPSASPSPSPFGEGDEDDDIRPSTTLWQRCKQWISNLF